MSLPKDIRQKAIALIEQLPQDRLAAVVQLLEFLAQPAQSTTVNSEEAALLQVIQHHLLLNEQQRLDDLRERCQWGELTEVQHQELIRYEDLLEQRRVERLEALMKLAELRNIDLIALNRQLKLESHPFHAV